MDDMMNILFTAGAGDGGGDAPAASGAVFDRTTAVFDSTDPVFDDTSAS